MYFSFFKAPADMKSPSASPGTPQGPGAPGQGVGAVRTDPAGAREEVSQWAVGSGQRAIAKSYICGGRGEVGMGDILGCLFAYVFCVSFASLFFLCIGVCICRMSAFLVYSHRPPRVLFLVVYSIEGVDPR